MPEPGIDDPDFNRPTTKSTRGSAGGRLARKRRRARIKLPGEYAEFQLNDGRLLIDVLGEKFFVPESGSDGGELPPANPLNQTPKGDTDFGGVFEGNPRFSRGPAAAKRALDRGDALNPGAPKGAPEGIGALFRPGMPDEDNEAGFTNLPFGPEEGDMPAESSVFGQRAGAGRAENPGRRPGQVGKPEFTSADIPDPRDRREFEILGIAMQDAERKIVLHEDQLDLYERRFKNKWIDAGAMDRARRYFEFRIGQQEALIARNENRLMEIRADALLDAATLPPGETPRAEDARADGARNDLGFWTFGLPLTAEGRVNESALRPGAVYRIPDSAGGGTGQWKSGAFYNFDQKSDWRLRTAADLDAYSGASDAPTPEERDEEALADIEEGLEIVKAGSAFTPAVIATKEDIDRFNEGDRGGIRAVGGDDEIVFDLGDGEEFLALPDDAAAHVIRNWEKYGPRLAFLSKLQDETLSPEERRRLVEEEVHRDVRAAESRGPVSPIGGRAAAMLQSKRSELRRVAEARLQAYDDLVAAMDSGTTDEEVAELLENFQQAMLPELLGWGPVIGEVVKDLVPDLSNVRSAIHAWNDLIEIAEEIEEGDVLGVVGNSGMLVLDLVGVIPLVGSAVAPVRTALKSGAKGAARALGRTAAGRIAGRWMARRRLAKYLDTATDKLKSKSVEEYFGKVWDDLTPPMQRLLRNRFSFLVGRAGELEMIKRARKAGFEVIDDFGKRKFGLSALKGGRQSRIFDFLTKEDFRKVWGGFFVAPGEKGNLPTGIEIKVNLSEYLLDQELADQFLKDTSKKIAGSEVLRLPAEMIKPEHLADAVDEWMKRPWREPWRRPHGVPRKEVEALVAALQASRNMSVGELFGLVLSYRLSREQLRGQREPQSSPAENAGPAEFFTASP